AVLSIEGSEDVGLLWQLQRPGVGPTAPRSELETPIRNQEHASGNGREGAGVGALEVIGDELLDLLLDDRPLKGLLGGASLLLQEPPVDATARLPLALPPGRLGLCAERKHLEPNQGLQVRTREKGLVEANAELIEPERGNGEHPDPSLFCGGIIWETS